MFFCIMLHSNRHNQQTSGFSYKGEINYASKQAHCFQSNICFFKNAYKRCKKKWTKIYPVLCQLVIHQEIKTRNIYLLVAQSLINLANLVCIEIYLSHSVRIQVHFFAFIYYLHLDPFAFTLHLFEYIDKILANHVDRGKNISI